MISRRKIMMDSGSKLIPWYLAGGIPLANVMAAYKPIGAASLAASYVNLISPGTNNAAPGVAPTHDPSYGWNFDGTQYLVAGAIVVPDSTWSIYIRFSDMQNIANDCVFGCYTVTPLANWGFIITAASTFITYPGPKLVGNFVASGTMGMAGPLGYLNAVPASGGAGAPFTGQINLLRIGSLQYSGTVHARIQAVSVYNIVLSQAQITALHASMLALT